MAGDWIPMRLDLAEDPAVIGAAAILNISEAEMVGHLHKLWGWANRHTTDGNAAGVTEKWIERYIGVTGFVDALHKHGWLTAWDDCVVIPKFERWNSHSAKKRLQTANRVRVHRNAPSVTEALPEKRREEVTTPQRPPKGGEVFHKDTDEICDHFDTALRWWRPKATNKPRSIQNRRAVSKLLSEHGVSRERLIDVIGHVFGACSKKPSATDYVPDPGSSFNWRINTQSAKKLLKHWDALDAMYSESVNGRAVV